MAAAQVIQPRIYTERVAVRITTELRDQLRAKLCDVGVAAAMRDETLCSIGRSDLVEKDSRDESGHQTRSQRAVGEWVTVGVNVTKAQKRALSAAAKSAGVALSALLRDSLVAELGLPAVESKPREDGRGGWPLGKRKSGRPGR